MNAESFDSLTREELLAKVRHLDGLVNSPQTVAFFEAARFECAHQVDRWGTVHHRAKQPQDWFWLVGYLAGKALRAQIEGDQHKALHHTISTAAALANWHAAITLGPQRGDSDLHSFLQQTFGSVLEELVPSDYSTVSDRARWIVNAALRYQNSDLFHKVRDPNALVLEVAEIVGPGHRASGGR